MKALAEEAGVTILTINALQKFNRWDAAREAEAAALAQYAHDCGAKALILVPVNDGTGLGAERHDNLRFAMKGLRPILKSNGITGLIEPLGFDTCSLRLKREAAEAIAAIDGYGTFAITHDTFHHHLAGDPELFPSLTGLVHISGVADPALTTSEMRDSHRVLVDGRDRLGNIEQIAALTADGYDGPFSFEPFADELRAPGDPAGAIRESMAFISQAVANQVA